MRAEIGGRCADLGGCERAGETALLQYTVPLARTVLLLTVR